jgi:peptidoglycan/xylan/chitin deacetylase (PgdA/CDA1 family)
LLLRLVGVAALAGLMALLFISDGGPLVLIHKPVAARPMGKATAIPALPPTPPPPLVYLMAHGNPKLREIALTFDDGPAPTYTEAVLSVL